jgi:hypothetical protein
MALFFPEGPINVGDKVVMGWWSGKDLYVLTDISGIKNNPYPTNYILENAIQVGSDGSVTVPDTVKGRLNIFQVGGTQSDFTLTEVFPGVGWLGITTTPTAIYFNKNPNVSTSFSATQADYYDWGGPTVFLAGAAYTVTRSGSKDIVNTYLLNNDKKKTASLVKIGPIFIPVVFYNGCTNTGEPFGIGATCQQTTDPYNAILDAYCGLTNQTGVGPCQGTPGAAWTTTQDAIDGVPYVYCPASVNACQPNCKAPCPNGYDYCQWTGSNFECKFNPNDLFNGEWWKQPWFIISVVVFVILVFILIVLLTAPWRQS